MTKRTVTAEAIHRFAVRSTRGSATIEGRELPEGYVRSERVEKFLAARRVKHG